MSMPAQSDARPRSSPERLDDAEPDRRERALLETLLGRAVAAAPADVLLKRFGGLGALLAADKPELRRAGLQDDHVLYLKAVRDLAVLLARTEAEGRPVISSWSTLQAYVRTALAHCPREQFRVLYLDHRNALMRDEWLAEGTVDHAPVYNAGPARVARLGRIPDIEETRTYVARVVDCYLALTAGRSARSAAECRSPGAVS